MPIYEFKCTSCGKRFERLCSMGEKGEKLNCPQCGAAGPVRVMSGFAAKGTERELAGGSGGSGCGGCTSTSCGSCGH